MSHLSDDAKWRQNIIQMAFEWRAIQTPFG